MTKDDKTLSVYDQRATQYEDIVANDQAQAVLTRFIASVPKGGRVLDLGCGPGHHAARMAAEGLKVDAWDGSVEMIARALNKPGVTAKHANFDDLTEVAQFDGIWASFSLLHASKAQFAQHLLSCHTALKPGGTLYIGMKTGTGERRDSIGRFYAYYSQSELETYLSKAGFTPFWHHSGRGKGLAGDTEPYIGIFSRA
ncbi:MAG: class I SAM-dependent methyltransferase [Paracoccaceae bacterium]